MKLPEIGAKEKRRAEKPEGVYMSEREEIERRAIEALKKFNPEAKNVNVFDVVPNFLGRTLVLLEFNYLEEGERKYDEAEEWAVLIDGENTSVHENTNELFRRVPDYRPSWFQQITSAQFILFLITATIVGASMIAFFLYGKVDQPLSAALSSVLGFWLGRAIPQQA
jgi:hypothetical protein